MQQPQPLTWPSGLHALAEADERAWLNQWVRGQACPTTLQPRTQSAPAPAPALAGRRS